MYVVPILENIMGLVRTILVLQARDRMTSHSSTVRIAMPIQTYRNRLHLIPTYYKNKHADVYIHTNIQTYLDIIKNYMNACTYQSTIPSHIPDTY